MREITTSNYNNLFQAQLSFVYDAVLETSIEGTGQVNARVFALSYNKWKQVNSRTKKACLKMQFEVTHHCYCLHVIVVGHVL